MLSVSCPLAELGDIFSFLASLAKAAAQVRGMESPASQLYFAPIPIDGLGFATGRTPDETLIVVSLGGFGMTRSPSSGRSARNSPPHPAKPLLPAPSHPAPGA
jgi:hypothetical protein